MKKLFTLLVFIGACYLKPFAQCNPATTTATNTINTVPYALNTQFNTGNGNGVIASLSSGVFSFTGSVGGGATWGMGVQIQNDATVGNYIYVQPTNTRNTTTTQVATYTFAFTEAVTNFSVRIAGVNNQDQVRITAFNGATPIAITNANFSDNVPADMTGTIAIAGGNTITGSNTSGGTAVTTNRITLTIPGPVTSVVMTSGKGDNSTSTVTLGFTSFGFTRCVTAPPDINATFTNTTVSGDVGTNDVKPAGTSYGAPTAVAGNPSASLPTINGNGTYTFNTSVPGTYRFTVPMCPGSVTTPNCAVVSLLITVTNASVQSNTPAANTDVATTPLNTAVVLRTLANDKAGNNSQVALNTASVTVTSAPANGTTSVNPATGNITYTPNNNFVGIDVLTYQVCDLSSPTPRCATAYQIITVNAASAVNTTIAADDFNSTPLNRPVSGSVSTNDSDPQNNTQTIAVQNTTIPGKGTLTLAANGNYTFTPVSGFTGPINFPYQVCDNGAPVACTNATLYLLVFPSAALPLDLISFTAVADNNNAKLIWKTANQDNVNRFEIERSNSSANAFATVGTVAANNSIAGDYAFTDANVGSTTDKAFYRLKMIDNDGRFKYSSAVLVSFGNGPSAFVRPTLVSAGQTVMVTTAGSTNQQSYTGKLYNPFGQTIREWKGTMGSSYNIETSNLPKGVYVVKIVQDAGVTKEKFVVQ